MRYTDQYSLYVYPGGVDAATTKSHHEGSIRLMLNGLDATLRTEGAPARCLV